jgi:hypothetical protein
MSECRDIEPLLVDRALGELVGLKQALVEAHLARCPRCREASTRLGTAMNAARTWQPTVDEAELDRMAAQLGPYLDAAQTPRWPGALGLGLAAALAALGVFGWWSRSPAPLPSPPITMAPAPELAAEPQPPPAPVRRRVLERGLKVLASADWDGHTQSRGPKVIELEMSRGFVVLDLQTPGQRLYLKAPDVTVEFATARVFVEIVPGSPTKIGVLAGQAQLSQAEGPPVEIGAGEALEVGADDPVPLGPGPTEEHRADDFLTEPPLVPAPKVAPPKAPKIPAPTPPPVAVAPPIVAPSSPPVAMVPPRPGVLEDLVEADALIRRGESGPALLLYDRVLASGLPPPQAAMVRFERARLWLKLGRQDEVRPELEALAQVGGEIGRQAAMLRCDLMGGCEARRCLGQLEGQVPAAELEQKATRHLCVE